MHMLRVIEVRWIPRLGHHRDRRRKVIGKVDDIQKMRAPIAQLSGAVIP